MENEYFEHNLKDIVEIKIGKPTHIQTSIRYYCCKCGHGFAYNIDGCPACGWPKIGRNKG